MARYKMPLKIIPNKAKQLNGIHLKSNSGFSLIELIVVIIILGVLASGISSFIGFGSQIFSDATDRDEVVSSARFVIERLNREIRTAVPNSIRVTTNGNGSKQCLEFTPLVLSAIYTDIAVSPEPASTDIKLIAFDEALFNGGFIGAPPTLSVGVYVLNDVEFYGGGNKIHTLTDNTISKVANEWTIALPSAQTFAEDSPTKRLYFFNTSVGYCLQNSRLTRHQNYARNGDNTPASIGVLMAENLTMFDQNGIFKAPFSLLAASQLRNSMVLIKLTFARNNEIIAFNNDIQVPNVP